jgi:hypothetical protein
MLEYAQIFLNGWRRALSNVTDGRVGLSIAVTTLVKGYNNLLGCLQMLVLAIALLRGHACLVVKLPHAIALLRGHACLVVKLPHQVFVSSMCKCTKGQFYTRSQDQGNSRIEQSC